MSRTCQQRGSSVGRTDKRCLVEPSGVSIPLEQPETCSWTSRHVVDEKDPWRMASTSSRCGAQDRIERWRHEEARGPDLDSESKIKQLKSCPYTKSRAVCTDLLWGCRVQPDAILAFAEDSEILACFRQLFPNATRMSSHYALDLIHVSETRHSGWAVHQYGLCLFIIPLKRLSGHALGYPGLILSVVCTSHVGRLRSNITLLVPVWSCSAATGIA